MIGYVLKKRKTYATWVYNKGVNNADTPVDGFIQWNSDLDKAKVWRNLAAVEAIAKLNKGTKVVHIEISRKEVK